MLGDIASDALRDRVLVLRSMPQFAALDEDDLVVLAEHAHLLFAREGMILFHEGEALDRIYLLARGAVEVKLPGRTVLIEQGEVGLNSLFAGVERAPEVVVRRDSTLLELPARVVLSSFYDSVAIARNTIKIAAKALLSRRENLPPRPEGEVPMGNLVDRSPTRVERILALRRSPVWAGANLDALAEMSKHVEERRVPAGTVLWEIGARAVHSVNLEYGIVCCTNDRGESVRVGGGFLLGGLDALAGLPRSYGAVAETDLVLFQVRAATQLAILEVHPQLAARFRMELSKALLTEREAAPVSGHADSGALASAR